MNSDVKLYLVMRGIRWLAWIAFFLYSLHYVVFTTQHIDHFGHLLPGTEAAMFAIPLLAIFAGFFELMARGRAGLRQPNFAQLVPAAATSSDRLPDR